MRILSTALLLGSMTGPAMADETARHPVIGDTPARELLNSDLLSLPDRERQAWLHGATAQMVQVLAGYDREAASCVSGWTTGAGDGQKIILDTMRQYPNERATVTVIAVAGTVCEGI